MNVAVDFKNVDIVFGADQAGSLAMVDKGATRAEILEKTGNVLGCAGANLTVHEGEISVLMGLSGSGKSTLLRAVNRLNIVSRGQVLVQGRRQDGRRRLLRRGDAAAAAPEPGRHGVPAVRPAALAHGRGECRPRASSSPACPTPSARSASTSQLKLVNLDPWAKKYAHELSGGMQQRVGLARAFATEAPILLMDEPFSALDPLIRTKLQDELLQLQETLKKTIIFVSHDLEEALKIGSHITIMEGGRIVQTGAPEDIVLRPANDYVRDFIANVNPLSVLTAWNVMRDRRDLEAAGDGWVWLDRRKTTRFKIDEDGLVAAAERDGKPADLGLLRRRREASRRTAPQVFWATPGTSLKTVMLAMHRSQTAPVALFDDQSRFVGAIGVRDVLSAVLRR